MSDRPLLDARVSALQQALRICTGQRERHQRHAGDRDNPDGQLDSAAASGADDCAKAIALAISRAEDLIYGPAELPEQEEELDF